MTAFIENMKHQSKNNENHPPKGAIVFLNWFCRYRLVEEIEGDLFERFEERNDRYASFTNSLFFWLDAIGFFRPAFWRKDLFYFNIWGVDMFKSNIKFALRNIYKNFFFSFINISGLAIGLACVLFIFFYVQYELSFDSFNDKGDRIYRVLVDANFNGNDLKLAETGGVVAPTASREFPEVQNSVRISEWGVFFIRYEDKVFKEYDIVSADSTIFDVFSIPVIQGRADKILSLPNVVAISRSAADKYFGNEDPIGKVLNFDERETYTVNGVFEDIPEYSHFSADFIVTHTHRSGDIDNDPFTNAGYYTYLLLNENADAIDFNNKFNPKLQEYVEAEVKKFGLNFEELKEKGTFWNFKLQKLSDIHFDTISQHDLNTTTDQSYIYIFSAIAAFILIIASINFINLSTAKSSSRAKEVGIKKVVGSFKSDLIYQFLTESVILCLISLGISILLVEIFKPYFFDILGYRFEFSYLSNKSFFVTLVALVIFTGLVAGSFPAFVLSGFSPVAVLKGNLSNVMKKGWFRSTLVVFQFTASIILIIGTIIVFNQLEYMQNKNLGFDKDQILIVDDAYILGDQSKVYKDNLLKLPNVLKSTISGYLPIESYRGISGTFPDGIIDDPKIRPLQWWMADYDYFETLNIKVLEGRVFSEDFGGDVENSAVINKAALEYFGWENPFEHSVGRIGGPNMEMKKYNIVGVVDNFHFKSLKNKVEPVIFRYGEHDGYISFKINGNIPLVIEEAEKLWKEIAPNQPFSYRFMDEAFNREYNAEMSLLSLFRNFAVLAVLIGCLGLFGLSAYTAEKRTK